MPRKPWFLMLVSSLVVAIGVAIVWTESPRAVAQTGASKLKPKVGVGSSKSKVGDSKELDQRAEKNLETFIAESAKLAEDYEKAGKFVEAQEQLRGILRLKPELPGVKEKIESLNEAIFQTNDYDVDLDVAESWKAQVLVSRGKPVRVEAPGSYKINLSMSADANGLPTKDPRTDMASGVKCGALMGIVVPVPGPGAPNTKGSARGNDKVGEPFEIGASKEFTPKEDGILLLNVNLPAGHKSTGKLRVHISGNIKMLPKELR
jgi:hypothetical protein